MCVQIAIQATIAARIAGILAVLFQLLLQLVVRTDAIRLLLYAAEITHAMLELHVAQLVLMLCTHKKPNHINQPNN